MNLTTEESRILRRELPAVRGLIDKGLITGAGILTDAGQRWIDVEYKAQQKQARAKGGEAGGKARAENLPRRERVEIAITANQASIKKRRQLARQRKAAAREKED